MDKEDEEAVQQYEKRRGTKHGIMKVRVVGAKSEHGQRGHERLGPATNARRAAKQLMPAAGPCFPLLALQCQPLSSVSCPTCCHTLLVAGPLRDHEPV